MKEGFLVKKVSPDEQLIVVTSPKNIISSTLRAIICCNYATDPTATCAAGPGQNK